MNKSLNNLYDHLYEEADRSPTPNVDAKGEQYCESDNPLYDTLKNITHRYENEVLIGEGGWKLIYRVHDLQAARDVAMARPRHSRTGGRYDAFLREAHITAKLEHANIIKLFDMGVDENGTPYFTMEFKRGKSLNDCLHAARSDKSVFPLSERLQVFLAVCDAISYAHSRRVLHLDIKPENIQVGEYGEVQVCDWGLGEIVLDPNNKVSTSEALLDPDLYGDNGDPRLIKGTPGFMAPEQMNPGEPHTFQTDVYALGKTLAVLISPERVPTLMAIVTKATATSPLDRYPSVKALRDDVHRFVTLHPTSVEPGGVTREAWLFVQRHQRSCTIAAAGLISIMVVSTIFLTELEISRRDQAAVEAEAKRVRTALAITKQEKEVADDNAEKASLQAVTATDMARAMIEGRHQDALEKSQLLMGALGPDLMPDSSSFENSIQTLENALKRGVPNPALVKQQLAYLYFVAQRFEKATELYSGIAADPDLQELASKIRNQNPKNIYLEPAGITGLFRRLATRSEGNSRLNLIEQMFFYDVVNNIPRRVQDRQHRLRSVTKSVLEAFNLGWSSEGNFDFNAEKRSLDLRGALLAKLANINNTDSRRPIRSFLQPLQLNSLTLRDTKVDDLSHLSGLNLWQLELINTPPKTFNPLRDMKSLQILRVDRPDLLQQARTELENNVLIELIEPKSDN